MGLLRIIKFSLQDMARNASLSFMTVLILVLMLLSVNTLIVVRVLTNSAVESINNQLDVSVHFVPEAEPEKIEELRVYLSSSPEVSEVTVLNAQDVLERFKQTNRNKPKILASLEELGKNPFGPTIIVKTHDPKDYEAVIASLEVPEYASLIQDNDFIDTQTGITKIHAITSQVERFTIVLSALFAFISFIIIFNTVRVAIFTQRIEISIKKLVGATNWFVRGPYIFESLFFTVISMGIAGALMYFALGLIDPHMNGLFRDSFILTNYYKSHILELAAGQFFAVLALTTLTSLLAMRRYLKV